MKLMHFFFCFFIIFSSLGSDCSNIIGVGVSDNGLMEVDTINGVKKLHPITMPMHIVMDNDLECVDAINTSINYMNRIFKPVILYTAEINHDLYLSLDDKFFMGLYDSDLYGVVLINQSGIPYYTDDDSDPGAVSTLVWNEYGEIYTAEIIINDLHAYDCNDVNKNMIHELGHVLGLEHDGYSIDMNSCMSSPNLKGCEITQQDIDLVLEYSSYKSDNR